MTPPVRKGWIPRLIQWCRREWVLLRHYRRPHVQLTISNCNVYGTLNVAALAQALTDPRITHVDPLGDTYILIRHVAFYGEPS